MATEIIDLQNYDHETLADLNIQEKLIKLCILLQDAGLMASLRVYKCRDGERDLDMELNLPNGQTDVFNVAYNPDRDLFTQEDFTYYVKLGSTPEQALEMFGKILDWDPTVRRISRSGYNMRPGEYPPE